MLADKSTGLEILGFDSPVAGTQLYTKGFPLIGVPVTVAFNCAVPPPQAVISGPALTLNGGVL